MVRNDHDTRKNVWEDPCELFLEGALPKLKTAIVHVDWNYQDALSLTFYPSGEDGGRSTIPGGLESIRGHLDSYADFLRILASKDYFDKGMRDSSLLNLEGVGQTMCEIILPSVARDVFRELPDGSRVIVSSNEEWVPWELLFDGLGFLGDRFKLFRLPRVKTLKNHPHSASDSGSESSASETKVVNVIGGGIPSSSVSGCCDLFRNVGPSTEVKLLHEQSLADLFRELGDADLLHMTCHGHRDPLRLQITRSDDQLVSLLVESLKSDRFQLKKGCLVYASACDASSTQMLLGYFTGFGPAFYSKGASAFIGPLGTVAVESAVAFAEAFYGALLEDEEGDVCHAYLRAKKNGGDHLSRLLYSYWGNPALQPRIRL